LREERLREQCVHRLLPAVLERVEVPQQVAEQEPGRDERERDRHVAHGRARRLHARLAQDRHAVADGLDAGVRAAAEREGAQEEDDHPGEAEAGRVPVEAERRGQRLHALSRLPDVRDDAADDQHHVADDEDHEDRR
jgi:hypothetical protein